MVPGQRGAEVVEVHLAFAGNDARLQVSELSELEDQLPDHGRRYGLFTLMGATSRIGCVSVVRRVQGVFGSARVGLAATVRRAVRQEPEAIAGSGVGCRARRACVEVMLVLRVS
jgi:hypothetical protein